MRVAIVGDYPLDSQRIRGGVQAAFAYLVKGLAQIDDLELHILTFEKKGQTVSCQIRNGGATLHLLPAFPRFERLRNYRTYRSILNHKLAQIQPDIVHAQDTTSHAYVALKSGLPAVVTAHGIRIEDGKYYGSIGRRLRNYFDSFLIERYIMRRTFHLIAISRYVTSYFASFFRPEIQIYHVPNAVDERFFKLASLEEGPTVLFAGRVIPLKRITDLIQAFAKIAPLIPSAQLRIAGECQSEPSYVERVRSLIDETNLVNRIHLLGPLSQEAILAEFARCTVLALPSAQENLPLVVAQAMAAGKPVVATRVGGIVEMVSKDTGFLVDPGDVDELAEALLRIFKNPALQTSMGQASHKYALKNYSAVSVAQRTFEVYKKISIYQSQSQSSKKVKLSAFI